jgi:hypothetical protein
VLTRDTTQELASKGLNVLPRKRRKVVVLQEIVQTHPQEFRDEAYMVAMVEPMQEMYAFAA